MATTSLLSGLDITRWREDFWVEHVRDSGFSPYMGESSEDVITVINDLNGSGGYTVRVPLLGRLKGNGVTGNTPLGGSEEQMDQYYQDITWATYRNAVAVTRQDNKKGVELVRAIRPMLKSWAAEHLKYKVIESFHKMSDGTAFSAANSTQKNTFATNNVDRILFGSAISNYSATHATGLGNVDSTSDLLSPTMGSLAKFMAKTASPHIRPFKTGTQGREFFVMFCHPICFRDLKNNSTMLAANRDARARDVESNPIFQDGDLIYDGVIYREIPEFYMSRNGSGYNTDTHLSAVGNGSIDVGANFLCGAQAMGKVNKQAPRPVEKKEDDYDYVTGLGIELMYGFDKLRWNNGSQLAKDVGIVTVYASAAA